MPIELPRAVVVSKSEGSEWVPLTPGIRAVHAIKFEDGAVWDTVNGWRQTRPDPELKQTIDRIEMMLKQLVERSSP